MIRKAFLISVVFSIVTISAAEAQSTRETGNTAPPPVYQAKKQNKKGFFEWLFGKKKDKRKLPAETQEDFQKRMKKMVRQKEREIRKTDDPQYSNKFYFGHKKKPKKRPPGKKKFCKICQFKH